MHYSEVGSKGADDVDSSTACQTDKQRATVKFYQYLWTDHPGLDILTVFIQVSEYGDYFCMIFCNLPLSNFFIRATFGLTANLPLICSKKKSDLTLVTLKWPGGFFLRKIFFTPVLLLFSIFCALQCIFTGHQGDPTILGATLDICMHFKAQFNTVGKSFAISRNLCESCFAGYKCQFL